MTDRAFVDLVARMRERQRRYFRDRSATTLDECKALEREVDRAVLERSGKATPSMFDDGDGS
ncbi:unnamed protein product [Gemmataceae bacterium]|nr:unnamed protein product [Gemmataceae bacterium]VTT98904.1 unnamed protein product [Gemmataceae bacterium]